MRYFILEDAFIVAEVVAAPTICDALYDEPFYRAVGSRCDAYHRLRTRASDVVMAPRDGGPHSMQVNRSPAPSWIQRHPWVTIGTCCLVGASIGFAVAASIPVESGSIWADLLRPFASVVSVAAGLLAGFLLGMVLTRSGRGGLACPRCGTSNIAAAAQCSACGLSLT
jgi:hypothetical protein